jgi:hypothetical protein
MVKLKVFLKRFIVLAIVFFVLRNLYLGIEEILSFDFTFRAFPLLLSFIISVVAIAAPTTAWIALVQQQGYSRPPFFKAYKIWFYSFMGRYVPGKVALILVRANMSKEIGLPPFGISNLAIAEVALFAGTSVLLAVPLQVADQPDLIIPAILLLLGVIVCLTLLCRKNLFIFVGKYIPIFKRIEPITLSFKTFLHVFLAYVVYWLLLAAFLFTFVHSFVPVSPEQMGLLFSAYALAFLGGMFAVFAPAGIGVRELAFATLIEPLYGIELAYLISVSLRVWTTFSEVLLFSIIHLSSKLFKK